MIDLTGKKLYAVAVAPSENWIAKVADTMKTLKAYKETVIKEYEGLISINGFFVSKDSDTKDIHTPEGVYTIIKDERISLGLTRILIVK